MNEAAYKKLSLLIKKYCPSFVEEKYPKFISFLQAYYDWSMNKNEFNPTRVVSNLIEWGDIDETLDEFIDYFKAEYLDKLNVDFNGDIADFIKHTKEFYSSRGTPESFRFLIKLLSGNSGEIFYPNQYLMKSSDGEWVKDHCIFVEFSDKITGEYLSTKIKGKDSGATAVIENIETHFNYNTQEQFLKIYISNLSGELTDDIIIFSIDGTEEIELQVYNTVKSINYIDRGNQYKVNDLISIENDPTFIGRVSGIYSGKVDSYVIYNGGSGYNVGDEVVSKCSSLSDYYAMPKVYVDQVDEDGSITSLDIRYPGYGFYDVPTVDHIERFSTVNLYAWRASYEGQWLDDIVYTTSAYPFSADPLYDSNGLFLKKTITSTSRDSEQNAYGENYIIISPSNYRYFRYPAEDIYNTNLKGDWNLVPEEYIAVKYIDKADGVSSLAYLDTGVYLNQNSGFEVKVELKMPPSPQFGYAIFGADSSRSPLSFGSSYFVNANKLRFNYGPVNNIFEYSPQDILSTHIIKQFKNHLYLNNILIKNFDEATFTLDSPAWLFGRSFGEYGGFFSETGRLYYAKFYDGNNIIRYYIPCKRVSDNVVGVYDIINDNFLTDPLNREFIAGPDEDPDIPLNEAEIEFISTNAGAIASIDVISAEINYTDNTPLIINSENGYGANITINTGKVFTSIPYYYKPGSFLSDEFKLQDSDYWQEYSYEIRSSLTLDTDILTEFSEYKDIFKQLVHPAGFKLFNSFVLSNHIDLSKIYINSTIDIGHVATFIEFANWIEMVSSWNRIVDNEIIFQHRFATIQQNQNTQINYYERTGGEYIHSTLEID